MGTVQIQDPGTCGQILLRILLSSIDAPVLTHSTITEWLGSTPQFDWPSAWTLKTWTFTFLVDLLIWKLLIDGCPHFQPQSWSIQFSHPEKEDLNHFESWFGWLYQWLGKYRMDTFFFLTGVVNIPFFEDFEDIIPPFLFLCCLYISPLLWKKTQLWRWTWSHTAASASVQDRHDFHSLLQEEVRIKDSVRNAWHWRRMTTMTDANCYPTKWWNSYICPYDYDSHW